MDFDRRGETLWHEWDGLGFSPNGIDNLVYYTVGHISLGEHVVFNALCSAIQRDGVCDSISRAGAAIQPYTAVCGYAGEVEQGLEMHVCSSDGETYYGDDVDEVMPITWVEVTRP